MMRAHFLQGRHWQLLAASFCFLFGVAFTLNIHPIGDGLWFWYAALMRSGQHLYADMHLPLQPLFVLLTMWSQELLGKGWLASKVLAFAQLAAYCIGLYLIDGLLPWKDWQKGILIISVFGMTMTALYFRFDDYHITGYCFEVYSIYLLLRLREENAVSSAAIMGALAGLSMSNRLNDGAALFAACGFALLFFVPRRKFVALCAFCGSALVALLCVILLTRDSIRDWANYSIFRAAAIKGGTGSVLMAPLTFPRRMFTELHHNTAFHHHLLSVLLLAVFFILMQRVGRRPDGSFRVWRIALGFCVLAGAFALSYRHISRGDPLEPLATLGVVVSSGLCLWVVWRLFRVLFLTRPAGWSPRELLLLFPILQILAGAMTSGKSILEVYPAVAVLLLVMPFSFPVRIWGGPQRAAFVAVAAVIACSSLMAKAIYPYHWHHFQDRAMFVDRTWYRHPVYGEIYIERDQLQLMKDMCAKMDVDGHPTEVLAITNPYPNWFCDVPPWHGYVQLWYDTTSKETIDRLIGELQTAPPKWIVYQRAEDTMEAHETVFLKGQALPHRALDKLIVDRIKDQTWQVAGSQEFEGAEWIVIQTRP
jgi:hypothetical protein